MLTLIITMVCCLQRTFTYISSLPQSNSGPPCKLLSQPRRQDGRAQHLTPKPVLLPFIHCSQLPGIRWVATDYTSKVFVPGWPPDLPATGSPPSMQTNSPTRQNVFKKKSSISSKTEEKSFFCFFCNHTLVHHL